MKYSNYIEPEYYNPDLHSGVHSEVHVPSILKNDGVEHDNYSDENGTIVNIDELMNNHSEESWMHRLVNTDSNSCCVIHQRPGEGNRRHYHPSWNEWWYILKGEWEFEIEDKIHRVKKGDLVFIPNNRTELKTAIDAWNIVGWNIVTLDENSNVPSGQGSGTYGAMNTWNVSAVTDMNQLFLGHTSFNDDISDWNVTEVTNTSQMFKNAYDFNQDISGWNVSKVTDMSKMFNSARDFNQDISSWNTANVTDMYAMFYFAKSFNQDFP